MTDLIWKIGGQAGEGIETTSEIFAKAIARLGLDYHLHKHFPSRIRGGHTSAELRIAGRPVHARGDRVDFLIAFDRDSIPDNRERLHPGAVVLSDPADKLDMPAEYVAYRVPFGEIAQKAGGKIVKNMVAIGAAASLLGMDADVIRAAVADHFARKGEKVVEMNTRAVQAGYDFARQLLEKADSFTLPVVAPGERLLMSGNEAAAIGALAAGCRVLAAYPITPATDILQYLAAKLPQFGGAVIQAEDEIAAINMTIGANWAGARAMTSTSGPGLSLMTEAFGLAAITETPLVIIDVQRPGPATGLPTKHEQSDLHHAVFGSHGDVPRLVLAPATVPECYFDTVTAFNVAERFQLPVIVLMDHALGMSKQTVPRFDHRAIAIDRGRLLTDEELAANGQLHQERNFLRYADAPDGVSPRSRPGQPDGVFLSTGDEHTEIGAITEDPKIRTAMVDKRFRKVRAAGESLADQAFHLIEPPGDTANDRNIDIVVSWGSTFGAVREAVAELAEMGRPFRYVHLRLLWPFPTDQMRPLVDSARRIIVIETNALGQLARLLKSEVGRVDAVDTVLKYDGTPFTVGEVRRALLGEHPAGAPAESAGKGDTTDGDRDQAGAKEQLAGQGR